MPVIVEGEWMKWRFVWILNGFLCLQISEADETGALSAVWFLRGCHHSGFNSRAYDFVLLSWECRGFLETTGRGLEGRWWGERKRASDSLTVCGRSHLTRSQVSQERWELSHGQQGTRGLSFWREQGCKEGTVLWVMTRGWESLFNFWDIPIMCGGQNASIRCYVFPFCNLGTACKQEGLFKIFTNRYSIDRPIRTDVGLWTGSHAILGCTGEYLLCLHTKVCVCVVSIHGVSESEGALETFIPPPCTVEATEDHA